LGEAGDWGSLNDAMKYADQLIGYADTAIQASTKAKDEAQAAVDALNAELTQYTQLKRDLEDFDPVLQSQLTSMTALAKQIHELENHALDVGLALGSLVGKSSVLPVLHTAQQLATSVLAIETVAKTNNRLSGVFVVNPDTMDASFQAIANSPVETSETDDEGLV
jgi:chromosome segregation ATPase